MSASDTIGFIGLGVMGGPMCRNMAVKHPGRVLVFDLSPDALADLSDTKAEVMASVAALAREADVVFLSLPGGPQVEAVCGGADGILGHAGAGTVVVDLSTTPVGLARKVGAMLADGGLAFADAPVARTREAAQRGELSIMVGASADLYERIRPLLDYVATDVTYGGDIGAGQVLKLANNMLVFANTVALAEMMVLAERAGVDAETLLDAVSKGSGDSFVLRNHGRKSMAPRTFPDKAFPPEYVLKDIDYVFQLADETGVSLRAADTARRYYRASIEHGLGGRYFPAVIRVVEDDAMTGDTE